jgi:hypothetical protein
MADRLARRLAAVVLNDQPGEFLARGAHIVAAPDPEEPRDLRARSCILHGPSTARPKTMQPQEQDDRSLVLTELFAEAVARYRTQCLWNMDPQASPEGLHFIAKRLRKYGGMDAWRLAGRIERSLADAAR